MNRTKIALCELKSGQKALPPTHLVRTFGGANTGGGITSAPGTIFEKKH